MVHLPVGWSQQTPARLSFPRIRPPRAGLGSSGLSLVKEPGKETPLSHGRRRTGRLSLPAWRSAGGEVVLRGQEHQPHQTMAHRESQQVAVRRLVSIFAQASAPCGKWEVGTRGRHPGRSRCSSVEDRTLAVATSHVRTYCHLGIPHSG